MVPIRKGCRFTEEDAADDQIGFKNKRGADKNV